MAKQTPANLSSLRTQSTSTRNLLAAFAVLLLLGLHNGSVKAQSASREESSAGSLKGNGSKLEWKDRANDLSPTDSKTIDEFKNYLLERKKGGDGLRVDPNRGMLPDGDRPFAGGATSGVKNSGATAQVPDRSTPEELVDRKAREQIELLKEDLAAAKKVIDELKAVVIVLQADVEGLKQKVASSAK